MELRTNASRKLHEDGAQPKRNSFFNNLSLLWLVEPQSRNDIGRDVRVFFDGKSLVEDPLPQQDPVFEGSHVHQVEPAAGSQNASNFGNKLGLVQVGMA